MSIKEVLGIFAKKILFSALVMLIVYCGLIAGLIISAYYFDFEYQLISGLSYGITVLCIIGASSLCALKTGEKGLISGIAGGIVFIIFLGLFSYFVYGELNLNIFLLKIPLFLLISALSGVIAINLK